MYLQLVLFFHTYHGSHTFFLYLLSWENTFCLQFICLHRFTPKVHFVLSISFKENREIVKYMRQQSAKIGIYHFIVDIYFSRLTLYYLYFSIMIHYTLWLCHCHSKTIYIVYFFVTYFIKLMNILSCTILQNSCTSLEDGHMLLLLWM